MRASHLYGAVDRGSTVWQQDATAEPTWNSAFSDSEVSQQRWQEQQDQAEAKQDEAFPCFQPVKVEGDLERCSGGTSESKMPPLPGRQLQKAASCTEQDVNDVLCEAGLSQLPPRRSASDAMALSSTVMYRPQRNFRLPACLSDASGEGPASSSSSGPQRGSPGSPGSYKSSFRGVSYDKKKRKWRVQIKVANLGKSGVSVGYFDTEEAAAHAYDRAAIGLLGRDNGSISTNFPLRHYQNDAVPKLVGKTREEVKATLKSERAKAPRRRYNSRQRTSKYMGVGSSNRKNQWQARILVHGKVTHLGYYETEEEAAHVYDRVAISLNGSDAQTNFPVSEYSQLGQISSEFRGLGREDLQRALGVKPMDKSSQFRGVSRKKGKWEAKVMVNRKWAYRELFDSEDEAARAYDAAVWRLKPKDACSYINFKDAPVPKRYTRSSHTRKPKSQGRSEGPATARSLPPLAPGILNSLGHQVESPQEPSTPSRRHSVQLPVTEPVAAVDLSRSTSMAASAMASSASHFAQADQLGMGGAQGSPVGRGAQSPFNPPQAVTLSPSSSFGRQGSIKPGLLVNQVMGGVPLLNLPDSETINLPPAVAYQASCGVPAICTVGMDGLPMPGLLSAPLQLPDIPPPLLPEEAARATMAGEYYMGSPLNPELAQAMAADAARLQTVSAAAHAQPNPFLNAASYMPPITSSPAMLVRVGSETHMISDSNSRRAVPHMSRIGSEPFVQQHFTSVPMARLASAQSGILHRVASESHMRAPMQPCELSLSRADLEDMQVDSSMAMPGMQRTVSLQACTASRLVSQHSYPGKLHYARPPLYHPSLDATSHHALQPQGDSVLGYSASLSQLPTSVFSKDSQGGYEHMPPGPMDHLQSMNVSLGPESSVLSYSSSFRSSATMLPDYLGMQSMSQSMRGGPIARSLSASSLFPPNSGYGRSEGAALLSHSSSSVALDALRHSASIDSGAASRAMAASMAVLQDMGSMHQQSEALAGLSSLGVDLAMSECHSPLKGLQIGGEHLHLFDGAVEDDYLLEASMADDTA